MKKLILIMFAVLTASALAYRLPTAWTLGGGLGYDSVRVTVYRPSTSSATLTSVKDTSFTTAGTGGSFALEVDSLVGHVVRYMYFSAPDTFREYTYNVLPVDYEKYVRAGVGAVRDSMDEASQTGSGQSLGDTLGILLTYLDAMRDSGQYYAQTGASAYGDTLGILLAYLEAIRDSGEYYAQVGSGSGGGCPDSVGNAWTIVAYDSVNSVYVPNALVTLKSSAGSAIPLAQAKSGFTFTAANGTYYVVIEANGVTFPLRSFAVSGTRNDTINGGGVTVVATSSPGMCTVYGQIDRNGVAAQGVWVEIALTRPDTLTIDSSFVELKTKVVTNSSGVWSANVYYLTGDTRNFYYTYKDAYGRVLTFRPTTTGSHSVKNILVDKP